MTRSYREEMSIGEKPHCPQCDGIELRRQGRIGFLQRTVLPRLGLFPWECGLCRKIFLLKQRSVAYRQHIPETLAPSPFEYAPNPVLCVPASNRAFPNEPGSWPQV